MIFTPFTGKDNPGRPVTFAAGLVCSEKTGAFAWLFKHFVECMGVAPKMIVTDQDLGMRSTIEEILVGLATDGVCGILCISCLSKFRAGY